MRVVGTADGLDWETEWWKRGKRDCVERGKGKVLGVLAKTYASAGFALLLASSLKPGRVVCGEQPIGSGRPSFLQDCLLAYALSPLPSICMSLFLITLC
jgi:hypothetical protein